MTRRNQSDCNARLAGRWRVVGHRWLDILVYAALSATALVVVLPQFVRFFWGARATAWCAPGTSLAIIVTTVIVATAMAPRVWNRVGRLRHLVMYPPIWTAAVAGLAMASAYWVAVPRSWTSLLPGEYIIKAPVFVLVCSASVGTLVALLSLFFRRTGLPVAFTPETRPSNGPPVESLAGNRDRLLAWLNDDRPIASPTFDAFGRITVARRIAARIVNAKSSDIPTIAIVGALGSGKTTLLKLVQCELAPHAASLRIVPFSAWPYESASAVVSEMLRLIVSVLEREVGFSALSSLPERYLQAIEGINGNFGRLIRAFSPDVQPYELLMRVDEVATAIGFRVILWVEDLERFAPSVGPETDATRERLAPIRALIYLLQELRSVSAVIASTSRVSGFDLEKIARYIEVLEPIGIRESLSLLETFRSVMRDRGQAAGVIDVASPGARKACDISIDGVDEIERVMRSAGSLPQSQWGPALATLCATPRTLKHGLRTCIEIWEAYVGEIDLDHVLAASLLRHGFPNAFEEVVFFADGLRAPREQGRQAPNTALSDPWGDLKTRLVASVDADKRALAAVNTVIKRLFASPNAEYPQGFQALGQVDYWRRYLSLPELKDDDRDQPIIKAIYAHLQNQTNDLVQICLEPGRARTLERFASLLTTEVVVALVDSAIRAGWDKPTDTQNPPGGVSLWRIALHRAHGNEWNSPAFAALIEKHVLIGIDNNLPLAYAILTWYGAAEETTQHFLSAGDRERLRTRFYSAFVERYQGRPNALAEALSRYSEAAGDGLLRGLIWGIGRVRRPDGNLPFEGWVRFANTVIEAARNNPGVMLGQLAWLVTSQTSALGNRNVTHAYHFEPQLSKRLFGEIDVLKLYRNAPGEVRDTAQAATPLRALLDATDEDAVDEPISEHSEKTRDS